MAYGNAARRYFPGMLRACPSCGGEITVTEQMCKSRAYACGPCQSARSVAYARQNREKKREWNNAYHKKISAKRALKTAAYRASHPDRKAAHQAVQTAVRNGSLLKLPCSVCGKDRAHAHHDDYSMPLEVIWLCHAHHMERHAMLTARQHKGEE